MKALIHLRLWLIALPLLLLTACVSRPQTPLIPALETDPAKAYAWELSGKILVKTPEDKLSANLYWLHSPHTNDMQLTTMLGTGILSMSVTPKLTTLEADGKTYTDTNAARLLAKLTGWQIPVDNLPRWITGQFSHELILARDLENRPIKLQTRDDIPWQINILQWQDNNPKLPKLMRINKGLLQLKIQINQWQALKPEGKYTQLVNDQLMQSQS